MNRRTALPLQQPQPKSPMSKNVNLTSSVPVSSNNGYVLKNPRRFWMVMTLILILQFMAFVHSQYQCHLVMTYTQNYNNIHSPPQQQSSTTTTLKEQDATVFLQRVEQQFNCQGSQECLSALTTVQNQSQYRLQLIQVIREKFQCTEKESCLETKLQDYERMNAVLGCGTQKRTTTDDNSAVVVPTTTNSSSSSSSSPSCIGQQLETIAKKNQFDQSIHDSFVHAARTKAQQRRRPPLVSGDVTQVNPNLIAPEYQPQSVWSRSYPKLNIVGMAKAGTSQLYHILTHHEETRPLHAKTKEFCVPYLPLPPSLQELPQVTTTTTNGSTTTTTADKTTMMIDSNNVGQSLELQKALYQYHTDIYTLFYKNETEQQQQKLTVNGCIQTHQLSWHYQYLPPSHLHNAKYFFLLRDPADLLWAAWNFWNQPALDAAPLDPLLQTNMTKDYRSPELFHEIIASHGKLVAFPWSYHGVLKQITKWARDVVQAVGREHVLFLRNEDMTPDQIHPSGFLKDISTFTGLSMDGFDKTTLGEITNCNDHKGERSTCTSSSSGLYSISGKRPMMDKTRQLIYLLIRDDCLLWKEEFDVEYKECLNALSV